jgi:hypothetical protein
METNNALPRQAVEEFKMLYKKRFRKNLDDKEASFRANNLFNLYIAVYGINNNINKKP